VELPVAALFDSRTVAGLAEVVDRTAAGVPAPPITPVDRDRQLPLSFGQQRLWFLAELEPGSVEYNAPLVPRGPGRLDTHALPRALPGLIEGQEVLRTRLGAAEGGEPYQVIDPPPAEVPVPMVDVSTKVDQRAAAERLIALAARVPFDLAAG